MAIDDTSATWTVPVSVIIPAFGQEAFLTETLARIFACVPLPQELLLNFDGGWSPTKDFTADAPIPVRIFRTEARIGPGGGRDRMIREASCEVIASFDDDAHPLEKDYFARVLHLLDQLPNAGALSARVLSPESPHKEAHPWYFRARDFIGCAAVYRKSAYLKTLGYVPLPHAYAMEEVDLGLQLTAAGYEIYRSEWFRVFHYKSERTVDWPMLSRNMVKNQCLLAWLRYPWMLYPIGVYQVLRMLAWILRHGSIPEAIKSLVEIPSHLDEHRRYRHVYSWRLVIQHLSLALDQPKHRLRLPSEPADKSPLPTNDSRHRVLYVQYTNPGGYPPLEHSAHMLADRGWTCYFLGVHSQGSSALQLADHPLISIDLWQAMHPGLLQKLHYLCFNLRVLTWALFWQPRWIYCSDPMAALPGFLSRLFWGNRVIYHEHDSPTVINGKLNVMHWVAVARAALSRHANAVILPNKERLQALIEQTGTSQKTFCVWNCPALEELQEREQREPASAPLRLLYHGSINSDRFPSILLEALAASPATVHIRLVGYETSGSVGYTKQLKKTAERLGVVDRFEYLGTLPQRSELMQRCAECHVGLAMLRTESDDINMRFMAGASNKAFDYLSQGLAIIVSKDQAWESLFVSRGCALSCDMTNLDDLTKLFHWLAEHREEVTAMGLKGRELIDSEWNYEAQFKPVMQLMES